MEQTRWLRDFIKKLWARKANDQTTVLRLKAPHGDEFHVEHRRMSPHTVHVCYYVAQPAGELVKDLEVTLLITPTDEWIPIEFYRAKTGHHVYVQVNQETGAMTLVDPPNQWACAAYCDAWSFYLREQGWLEKGQKHEHFGLI